MVQNKLKFRFEIVSAAFNGPASSVDETNGSANQAYNSNACLNASQD